MKLVNKNLKKVGYFNALLIVVAIIFRLYYIGTFSPIVTVDSAVCTIALIFGLFYSLNGYKKAAAKYYKGFMYLYFVSSALSFGSTLYIGSMSLTASGLVIILCNLAILLLAFILSFIKDFGEKKSNSISLTILILNTIKLVLVLNTTTSNISIGFANLMLACILCVFVSAKYIEKESRGAI